MVNVDLAEISFNCTDSCCLHKECNFCLGLHHHLLLPFKEN